MPAGSDGSLGVGNAVGADLGIGGAVGNVVGNDIVNAVGSLVGVDPRYRCCCRYIFTVGMGVKLYGVCSFELCCVATFFFNVVGNSLRVPRTKQT